MTKDQQITLTIKHLNERGYGVGKHEKQPVFVLNALPGEIVKAKIFKKKQGLIYATAVEILQPSKHRREPKEDHFLACSPWQILDFEEENKIKKEFIQKFFQQQAGTILPDFEIFSESQTFGDDHYHYRNKVEYSFYGDENEVLSLAYFMREGNFGKYPHRGCILMKQEINQAANKILDLLNSHKIQARQLKSLILRYSYLENEVVAALYCKDDQISFGEDALQTILGDSFKGMAIIHSTKKSPAAVITGILDTAGQVVLNEEILGLKLSYNFDSFFQINPPAFQKAAQDIQDFVKAHSQSNRPQTLVDLYAGVGTIGLTLAKFVDKVIAVEVSPGSQDLALKNALQNGITNFEFLETSAENALETIEKADFLVVDPPRTGLWAPVIAKILENPPKFLIYLSCNPESQAANFAQLKDKYQQILNQAYNFYPHTPHVENLIILQRRAS